MPCQTAFPVKLSWNTELRFRNATRSCFVSSWGRPPQVCESSWAIRCYQTLVPNASKYQVFATSCYCFRSLWVCSCNAYHLVVTNLQTGFHLCLRSSEVTASRADFSVLALVKLWRLDTGVPSGELDLPKTNNKSFHTTIQLIPWWGLKYPGGRRSAGDQFRGLHPGWDVSLQREPGQGPSPDLLFSWISCEICRWIWPENVIL